MKAINRKQVPEEESISKSAIKSTKQEVPEARKKVTEKVLVAVEDSEKPNVKNVPERQKEVPELVEENETEHFTLDRSKIYDINIREEVDSSSITYEGQSFSTWKLLIRPKENDGWVERKGQGFRKLPAKYNFHLQSEGGLYELAFSLEEDSEPICFYLGLSINLHSRLLNDYAQNGSKQDVAIDAGIKRGYYVWCRWLIIDPSPEDQIDDLIDAAETELLKTYNYAYNKRKVTSHDKSKKSSSEPRRPLYIGRKLGRTRRTTTL